jgi:uncharacterized protein (TIGR02453 family)
MAFRGWPDEAFDFYTELAADNSRSWWQEHRDTYDRAVKEPFAELAAAVEDEFGPLRLFRPNRDTRFSKDKSPYKTTAAAMTESEGGSTYYVQVSADGLFAGAGMYHLAPDQLERYRDAVRDDRTGGALATITDTLAAGGYDIAAAETLKTAPRGWDKQHPRIELARRKGVVMARTFPRARWQSTARALERIVTVWRDAEPLSAWLGRNVGPSSLPPPEAR